MKIEQMKYEKTEFTSIRAKYQLRRYFNNCVFSVSTLIKWLVIAACIGLIVGVIGACFGHSLTYVNHFRAEHPWIMEDFR